MKPIDLYQKDNKWYLELAGLEYMGLPGRTICVDTDRTLDMQEGKLVVVFPYKVGSSKTRVIKGNSFTLYHQNFTLSLEERTWVATVGQDLLGQWEYEQEILRQERRRRFYQRKQKLDA